VGFDQGRIETEYEIETSCHRMPLTLFAAGIAMKCVWPRREQLVCVSRGQIGYLRCEISPFQLVLMSHIQGGDGAARADAEDEEHKPFSHGSASSPG
jgi:hypothetical protein